MIAEVEDEGVFEDYVFLQFVDRCLDNAVYDLHAVKVAGSGVSEQSSVWKVRLKVHLRRGVIGLIFLVGLLTEV